MNTNPGFPLLFSTVLQCELNNAAQTNATYIPSHSVKLGLQTPFSARSSGKEWNKEWLSQKTEASQD